MVEQTWQGKKAVVIINPRAADGHNFERSSDVAVFLRKKGLFVEEKHTERPGHAIKLAKKAAKRNVDLVVAVGGDGTLNEVINGLSGSETAMAAIPAGTVNIYGHETGTPVDTEAAIDAMLDGEFHRVDLLSVRWSTGKRKALLGIGFNYDAQVFDSVHKADEVRKKGGVFQHFKHAITQLPHADTPQATVSINGEEGFTMDHFSQGWLVNTQRLTQLGRLPVRLDPQAQLDNGKATFIGYGGRYRSSMLNILSMGRRLALDIFHPRDKPRSDIHKEGIIFQLDSTRPFHIHGDGTSWAKDTHVDATVLTGALRVLVPKQTDTTVFQYPGVSAHLTTPLASR